MGILPFSHEQNAVPIAMKLRLPSRLVQALLTTCAAALSSTTSAYADVPQGYTPVIITDIDQLANYTKSNYIAFIISSAITDNAYRMKGAHQYWTDDVPRTHVLTFTEIESASDGGALSLSTELIAEHLQELNFSQNVSTSSKGGAISGYSTSCTITFNDNGSVTFSGNSASSDGGAIYGHSSSTITLNDNDSVKFSGNSAVGDYAAGGAIYAHTSSAIALSGNENLTFSENTASTYGGAICGGYFYGSSSSVITISDNGSVTFSGNSATGSSSDGGAIFVAGTLNLTDNGSVTMSGNSASFHGGAISGYSSSGTITIIGNETVTFCENSASSGGAIYAAGTLNLTDNGSVTMSGNSASFHGGAISGHSSSSAITISGNETVTFCENSAVGDYAGGGAIYAYTSSTISLSGNETVTFCENSTSKYGGAIYGDTSSAISLGGNKSVTFSGNSVVGDYAYGGAIYGHSSSTITLRDNETVTFSGNFAVDDHAYGGAIYGYTSSTITLSGNEIVTFRGNYERVSDESSATYRLRSVYMRGSSLEMAAGTGQNITFYDTLYADSASMVSFNAKYMDKDGVEREAAGDIVFSGKYAEEDLEKLKANPTAQELTNSLTSEVNTTTNLYGGRLRIEDGAIYKGYGINVATDSSATLRLKGGTLTQTGYNVILNAGTTLDVQGVNSITAITLDMRDGSIMSFTLGETNKTKAAVTLDGIFNQGGALTIQLADDGTIDDGMKYSLLTMSSGEAPDSWETAKITVTGLKAKVSDLSWENGTLYFTTPTPPDLLIATWSGAVSSKWNTTEKNWIQREFEYRYKDGVDVVFGDAASGEIELEGTLSPKSVLVENSVENDYAFIGEGSIAGAAELIKEGAGKLTIATANTYGGGTVLNGGTVVLGTSTALGTGDIQLNDGVLDMRGNTIDNNIVTAAQAGYAHAAIGNGATTGNLTITNTYLTVSGDVQIDGQIQANSENSITVASDATLGISKTITNTGDYLEITGRIDISKMHGGVTGSEYTGAENSENGFLRSTESVQVFNNTSGGDIELRHATFYHLGTQIYLDNDFKTAIQSVDYSTFYVNVDSEKLSSALDATVELKDGTQLYVDHDTDADLLHVVSGTATMDIAQGVTLAETDTTRTDFILQGKGRYSLMSGSTTLGATMSNSWHGIVQINGATFSAIDLNDYGTAGSTVSMNGVAAKFVDGTKFLPTVELLGEGLSITECRTNQSYEFAGGVTGTGVLTYRLTKMPNNQTYIFTGDVSQWTGAYDSDADGKSSSLVFYGKATKMGAAILQTAGTINVEVGDGSELFTTTFMNTVQATNFAVLEDATAIFTTGTQIAEKLDSTGTMQIQAEGSLSVGGVLDIRAVTEGAPGTMSGIIATATQLNPQGKEKAELTGCYVEIKDNYTMENVSVSGTVIDIGAGKTLYVKHADIKADARITDEAAWLDMVDTHGWFNEDNTDASAPTMDLANVMFYKSGETDTWMWLTEDVSYVALTSDLFSNVTLTGSDLWLDLTELKDTIGNAQAFSIAFKDALYDVNGLHVVATVDGEHYFDGYYTTQQSGTTTTLYFSQQIPEPTSSTLSLLALTALAGRRRKQQPH